MLEKFTRRYFKFIIVLALLFAVVFYFYLCNFKIHDSPFDKGTLYEQFEFNVIFPLAAKSSTDTFPIDNVSFELLYGLHKGKSPSEYSLDRIGNREYTLALYVCEEDENGEMDTFFSDMTVNADNYHSIPYHHLFYSVPDEDVRSAEYYYSVGYNRKFNFNHSEAVKIPEGVFKSEQGKFQIHLILYIIDNENSRYIEYISKYLQFSYEKTDDKTVKLDFNKNKAYIP